MNNVFDLLVAINDKILEFVSEKKVFPCLIAVSRDGYRALIEIRSKEQRIGTLVIGCGPIVNLETKQGAITVQIDEMLTETEIVVA